ncbi:MAG: DUF938 domain-containing protein [Myxococcales bacterium]|nr:DUF938 domain-containing protein [Myxococcales bacterium]
MIDARRSAPATQRNREPILEVLTRVLPAAGVVLELGSGTGEHAVFFAANLPGLVWQPSDPSAEARASVEAWRAHAGVANVRPALELDARADAWPGVVADAVVAINVIHISPWETCEGLLRGAGRVLGPGGVLYLYGPYRRGGRHTAPSNEAFDLDLRARDPSWGVRDLEAVVELAERRGLSLAEVVEMPANNLSVVLRRG